VISSDSLGAHHPLFPVIKLAFRHPRKKERKNERFHQRKHGEHSRAPTSKQLLARPAGLLRKDGNEPDNPEISRSGRLHSSQIPKALSVSAAVVPPRHFSAIFLPFYSANFGNFVANQY